MNVLFLSDIHFGREEYVTGNFSMRKQIQQSLIDTVKALPECMKPQYIILTGDIAWTGAPREYNAAEKWLNVLLASLGLDGSCVSFCAGNHDVNRNIMVKMKESDFHIDQGFDLERIDNAYRYENIADFNVQIAAYSRFCEKIGVLPYSYEVNAEVPDSDKFGYSTKRYSYTVGTKEITQGKDRYRIVSFNTAMLSGYSTLPDDENFIGLPQVEDLIKKNKIGKKPGENVYTIALFHHAERFLNTNEMNSYGTRKATLTLLMENVDLALCGHTETGERPVFREHENGGKLLNGGAAYYSDDHPNSFSVLNINPNTGITERCTFRYHDNQWTSDCDLTGIHWDANQQKIVNVGIATKANSCVLRIIAKDKHMDIPVNIYDHGLYADGAEMHRYFTNYRDVNRLLSVSGDESGFSVGMAEGMDRFPEAMLQMFELHKFVYSNLEPKDKAAACYLLTEKGIPLSAGLLPYCAFSDEDNMLYEILNDIKKLQDIYHIYFSVPDKPTHQDLEMLQAMQGIYIKGNCVLYNISVEEVYYSCDDKDLFHNICDVFNSGRKKSVALMYRAPMKATFLGATIRLGYCKVYLICLVPADMNELVKQDKTFVTGDTRKIRLRPAMGTNTFLIIRENSESEEFGEGIKKFDEVFEIPPQDFRFGKDQCFSIDKKTLKKDNVELKTNLRIPH